MLLEVCSAAVFAPPPPIVLYEPADRRGTVPTFVRAPTSPASANVAIATTVVEEPPSEAAPKRSDFVRMALDVAKRVQSLKIEAELDGVPFSLTSYQDFLSFLKDTQPRSRPSLFLNDNGNLRALWRNEAREQIGLQFLGGGNVQFVIFKRRPGTDVMARVIGTDTKANIRNHIVASGALGLLAG